MKLIITLFAGVLLMTSCAPTKVMPFKGDYVDRPVAEETSKPFDEVWNNLIDVLAAEGFPIKLLDKENGLVVSERTSLRTNYTFEGKDGKLERPDAFIVFPTISNSNENRLEPAGVTAIANIRVRDLGNGRTRINPNLTSIQSEYNLPQKDDNLLWGLVKSTGVFESFILDAVK